ncbi:MAG TPA: ribonuclease HII [Nitrospirota bacterium]|nr:ribonuclease HII [Nitrospirota bacterium]
MPRSRVRLRDHQHDETDNLFRDELASDPLYFERIALQDGYNLIAGLDEAGRGPLAGPVVAAAVILPHNTLIPGLTDSKQVSKQERERLFAVIRSQAVCYAIGTTDERTIDEVNIYQATIIAMERAIQAITPQPDYLLLDAIALPRVSIPQKPLIKGDCRSHSIAAASIIAKVTRDRMMLELHKKHPQYHFHKHKGYGTKEHLSLLQKHGPCEAHRRSFQPVALLFKEKPQ